MKELGINKTAKEKIYQQIENENEGSISFIHHRTDDYTFTENDIIFSENK